jgi:hypothetical protein
MEAEQQLNAAFMPQLVFVVLKSAPMCVESQVGPVLPEYQ